MEHLSSERTVFRNMYHPRNWLYRLSNASTYTPLLYLQFLEALSSFDDEVVSIPCMVHAPADRPRDWSKRSRTHLKIGHSYALSVD